MSRARAAAAATTTAAAGEAAANAISAAETETAAETGASESRRRRLIGIVAGVVAGVVVGHLRRLRVGSQPVVGGGGGLASFRALERRAAGDGDGRRRRSRRRYFQLSPPRASRFFHDVFSSLGALGFDGWGWGGTVRRRAVSKGGAEEETRVDDSDADRKPARAAMGRYFVADPAFGDATIPDALRRRLVRFYDPLVDDLNALLGNGETRWWDADGASTPALQRETLVAASRRRRRSNGRRGCSTTSPSTKTRRTTEMRHPEIRHPSSTPRTSRVEAGRNLARVEGGRNVERAGERRRRRRGAFVSVSRGERAPFARSVLRRFDSAMSRVDGRVRHGATRCCDEEWVGAISTGGSDDGAGTGAPLVARVILRRRRVWLPAGLGAPRRRS